MTAAETDQQLVAKVQKGDARAFDLLVLKYQHRIFGLIGRYVHDADEVQDVAQEAFIKAYRALPDFRGESAFYTWLYRIAINTAKNYLVSRSRRPPGSDVDIEDAEHNTTRFVVLSAKPVKTKANDGPVLTTFVAADPDSDDGKTAQAAIDQIRRNDAPGHTPAEVNRLNHQVLVHYYAREWSEP